MNENKPTIYIIEDDESISKLVCMYLEKQDIKTKSFNNAENALETLSKEKMPDLIILDLNLPGMSGFDFLQEFKKSYKSAVPVMITSARSADEDIINGLGFGADEFITKPFSPGVLVARVQAALRRQAFTTAKAEETINFGEFTLLLNSGVLKKGTVKIPLSTKEYEVLEFLVKNSGKSLTPEEIYKAVWKVEYGDITAVAVYIQRLRRKLAKNSENADTYDFIKTEFGKGYVFNKETVH